MSACLSDAELGSAKSVAGHGSARRVEALKLSRWRLVAALLVLCPSMAAIGFAVRWRRHALRAHELRVVFDDAASEPRDSHD